MILALYIFSFSVLLIAIIIADKADKRKEDRYIREINEWSIRYYSLMLSLVEDGVGLNGYAKKIHNVSKQWWVDLSKPCPDCQMTGVMFKASHPGHSPCLTCHGEGYLPLDRNVGELLMLMVSELAEAMEGDRKNLMDDHLPHRKMIEVELADVLIRIFDFAGAKGYDLEGAVREKNAYNQKRADHKIENRLQANGKKY